MTHDVHQNYSSDWQTPPEWIAWAHKTMGRIDLDPCASPDKIEGSDHYVNPTGAKRVICPPDNGLAQRWRGRVYVNPPGANSTASVKLWWEHAHRQRLTHLTWCFFNVEALRHVHPCPMDLLGYLVMPLVRTPFLRNGVPVKSPRNWTWWWTTAQPTPTPVPSRVIPTGSRTVGVLSYPGAPHD